MGAENRVAIAKDLVLDFSGLFASEKVEDIATQSPVDPFLVAGEYKTLTETQKPAERLTEGLEGQQAKKLYLDTQREREDRQRSLEVYRTYQENIKTSSQLQTEILKGLKAGEDVYSLFLKAAKAISLMTANSLFYSQIEADIEAIYGRGLQHKPPLQKALQEVQERLQRLLEAEQREQPPDSRERIQRAIEAHRATIERLKDMITKTGIKQSGEL
jgi:uncharacterized membrane protein YccC